MKLLDMIFGRAAPQSSHAPKKEAESESLQVTAPPQATTPLQVTAPPQATAPAKATSPLQASAPEPLDAEKEHESEEEPAPAPAPTGPKTIPFAMIGAGVVGVFLESDITALDGMVSANRTQLGAGLSQDERLFGLFTMMITRAREVVGGPEISITATHVDGFIPGYLMRIESSLGERLDVIELDYDECVNGRFSASAAAAFEGALPKILASNRKWLVEKFVAGFDCEKAIVGVTGSVAGLFGAAEVVSDIDVCAAVIDAKARARNYRNNYRKNSGVSKKEYVLPCQVLVEKTGLSSIVCHYAMQRAMNSGFVENGFQMHARVTAGGKLLDCDDVV